MKQVTRDSFMMSELADELEQTHSDSEVERVNLEKITPHIRRALGLEDSVAVEFTNPLPTNNSARPKSVLMSDFETSNGEEYVAELLCTENTEVDSDQVTHHDDGTISIPVSAFEEPTHRYDSLELVIYRR